MKCGFGEKRNYREIEFHRFYACLTVKEVRQTLSNFLVAPVSTVYLAKRETTKQDFLMNFHIQLSQIKFDKCSEFKWGEKLRGA